MLADLNGDGFSDLYVVNYLGGHALQGCDVAIGRLCAPTRFPAAQDQVYVNLGDGRFENVTPSSGIVAHDGKGLGIVAADFDGSGRLSLLANHAVAMSKELDTKAVVKSLEKILN